MEITESNGRRTIVVHLGRTQDGAIMHVVPPDPLAAPPQHALVARGKAGSGWRVVGQTGGDAAALIGEAERLITVYGWEDFEIFPVVMCTMPLAEGDETTEADFLDDLLNKGLAEILAPELRAPNSEDRSMTIEQLIENWCAPLGQRASAYKSYRDDIRQATFWAGFHGAAPDEFSRLVVGGEIEEVGAGRNVLTFKVPAKRAVIVYVEGDFEVAVYDTKDGFEKALGNATGEEEL